MTKLAREMEGYGQYAAEYLTEHCGREFECRAEVGGNIVQVWSVVKESERNEINEVGKAIIDWDDKRCGKYSHVCCSWLYNGGPVAGVMIMLRSKSDKYGLRVIVDHIMKLFKK